MTPLGQTSEVQSGSTTQLQDRPRIILCQPIVEIGLAYIIRLEAFEYIAGGVLI
jgi:hypothetical protein